MVKYLIVLEPTATGFSAYSPDLPGCVATGATQPEVEANMREAIALHLEGLREDGAPVPPSQTIATYVEVAA
jgi:predicted RNase H-like HicB family nuclease